MVQARRNSLLLWGFTSVKQIEGLEPADIARWKVLPKPEAIIQRTILRVNKDANTLELERRQYAVAAVKMSAEKGRIASACAKGLAVKIQPQCLSAAFDKVQGDGQNLGFHASKMTPNRESVWQSFVDLQIQTMAWPWKFWTGVRMS